MDTLLSELESQYPRAKISQPNRLFYGKYQHRITVDADNKSARHPLWLFRNQLLTTYIDEEIRCRVETGRLNIFVNDLQIVKDILNKSKMFNPFFRITELSFDKQSRTYGTIAAPKIKQMGYQYRVYFKTGNKYRFTLEKKAKLADFFNNNRDQCRIGEEFKYWLQNNRSTVLWQSSYFYIKDSSMLTFFQLKHADSIDKIYQVV